MHVDFVLPDGMHLLQRPFTPDGLLRQVRAVLDASRLPSI
jgi:hypothetical protein